MVSNEPLAPSASRPGRDTVLRQLLRPLAPFLERPEVTELAINWPGNLWTPAGSSEEPTLAGREP